MEKASFGAGCFWGVELAFRQIEGIINVEVGYAGGAKENPSYEDVCRGDTGHAEIAQVTFDPEKIPYKELVKIFFAIHDPTQIDGQGVDFGTQYRSVIFTHSQTQHEIAISVREELENQGLYKDPIVTAITPLTHFYKAEEYHQNYLAKLGIDFDDENGAFCHLPPKIG